MKKLFTFILLLAAVMQASATETVLATLTVDGTTTGEWANTLTIDGAQLTKAGAKAGDIVRLTFSTEDGAQLQLAVNSPAWSNLVPCFDVTAASSPYDLTLDATSLASIEADKLYIQGKLVTVSKAELITTGDVTKKEETVVATLPVSGTTTGEWTNTLTIEGTDFTAAGAQKGDIVRITFAADAGAQLQLCVNSPAWSNLVPCFDVTAASSPYDLTLDETSLASIEADKLYIQGKYLTIEKVELVRQTTTAIAAVKVPVKADNVVYSLSGVRQNGALQRGIYIKNGKKFMVK
jgi:hypothetical protein